MVVAGIGVGRHVTVVGIDDRERIAVLRPAPGDLAIGGEGRVAPREHDDRRRAARLRCSGKNRALETVGKCSVELGAGEKRRSSIFGMVNPLAGRGAWTLDD